MYLVLSGIKRNLFEASWVDAATQGTKPQSWPRMQIIYTHMWKEDVKAQNTGRVLLLHFISFSS